MRPGLRAAAAADALPVVWIPATDLNIIRSSMQVSDAVLDACLAQDPDSKVSPLCMIVHLRL